MQRLLASLIAIPALTTVASAQICFEQNFGVLAPNSTTGIPGYGDDVFFDVAPMNINFPLAGNSASYSHAHISDNGIIYLTNGAPTNGPMGGGNGYQNLSVFLGQNAGNDPRVAPLFADLWCRPQDGGGVFFNNTIPGKFVVTWSNMVEWWATTQPGTPTVFTFQAQLFANGDVLFYYSPSVYGASYTNQIVTRVGISQGNGVADPGASNLTTNPSNLASFVLYEEFPVNVFDLQDTAVQFVNAGTGYLAITTPCLPAYNENYGEGCYDISDSFYQSLPDSSTAPATLNGQSMTFTPAGSNYAVTWGGGSYVTPVGATTLTITDDGEVAQTLSAPFPSLTGPVNDLFIAANGIVSTAPNPAAPVYVPAAATFLDSTAEGWYSWHDYNPTEAGSGPITYFEQVVSGQTIAYFSWQGVESYAATVIANPSTLQFQFNLTTGAVRIVWVTIDGDPSSPFGSAHLIGWSPAGPSANGGSINIATAAPFTTIPTNVNSLALSASPAPVSSTTVGSTVVFTTSEMPPFTTNVYIGLTIASLVQNPGLDLGFIGAPGCRAYIGSLDFQQVLFGGTPTNSVSLALPPGLTPGLEIFSQSIALIPAFGLPNGQNAFGMTTSNGVLSKISNF